MTILVTGTSGHLGRLVVEALLQRGTAPADLVATARDLSTIADLAERGVVTRRADYDDPASLDAAFAGVDRLLLVSSSTVGTRVPQHRNVVDAAVRAGVGLLAYTSIAHADRSGLRLAEEHLATERLIAESGLAAALLRNSWYLETYTDQLPTVLATGTLIGSAGDGRVSAATRADYAEAAAAVLLADEPAGTYELGGDEAFSLAELAKIVTAVSGTEVTYRDLPEEEYAAALVAAGLPEGFARVLADSDRGLARGELYVDGGELGRLLGRPTTTPAEAVGAALA